MRAELARRRAELEERIGKELVDKSSAVLQFGTDSARAGKIGWAYFLAEK